MRFGPLVCRRMEMPSSAAAGAPAPLGPGWPPPQPSRRRPGEVGDALEPAPGEPLARQLPEPPREQGQPPGAAGREAVKVEARVACEPAVAGGVVPTQVQGGIREALPIEEPEEPEPLRVPELREAGATALARREFQGRDEGRRAVPPGVRRHAAAPAPLPGQSWRGPVEGLDLALLLGAQPPGRLGRMQVPPDHVGALLETVGGPAPLERVHPMQLEPVGLPDAGDALRAEPDHGRQGPGAPVERGAARSMPASPPCAQRVRHRPTHALPVCTQLARHRIVPPPCGHAEEALGPPHEVGGGAPPRAQRCNVVRASELSTIGTAHSHGSLLLRAEPAGGAMIRHHIYATVD
jgi:hypothetical protein